MCAYHKCEVEEKKQVFGGSFARKIFFETFHKYGGKVKKEFIKMIISVVWGRAYHKREEETK